MDFGIIYDFSAVVMDLVLSARIGYFLWSSICNCHAGKLVEGDRHDFSRVNDCLVP